MTRQHALDGIVILERAGRLAGAVGASLLAELGATVIRVTDPNLPATPEPAAWQAHPLALAGKTRLQLSRDGAADDQWRQLLERADAVIYSPPLPDPAETLNHLVRCDVSAFGQDGCEDLPDTSGEAILQAIGGMMSTTGLQTGPPELIGAPLVELFTGFNCAISILAALRIRECGGTGQRIDLSAFDSSVVLVGAFVGHVQLGKGHDLRGGATHPLCCPWNAYPTRDGWILMCSSTEPHWDRILELIGLEARKNDPRFADMDTRVQNRDFVDGLIGDWTRQRTTDQAVRDFESAVIPAGAILTIPDLIAAADGPPAHTVSLPQGSTVTCPKSILRLSRCAVDTRDSVTADREDVDAVVEEFAPKPPDRTNQTGRLPLDGVRVIEVGLFTAGPLGGRYLTDLGADVIKVEQPGGETGRVWSPNFGGVSGYFATYNAGKRSVTLDLRSDAGKAGLDYLIGDADVLLQNLKSGALDRLGFAPRTVLERHPRLIYCSVSGYGSDGSKAPALDTVIQAQSGLMSLIDAENQPIKAGLSVADLLASHVSPLTILAALRHRDRTGEGQHIDISMRDALAWMTQLTWPDGAAALPQCCRLTCADGWVVAEARAEVARKVLKNHKTEDLVCAEVLALLRRSGLIAAKVLELDEIFDHAVCTRRNLLGEAVTEGGEPAPVLASPFALTASPLRTGRTIPTPGEDNALIAAAD